MNSAAETDSGGGGATAAARQVVVVERVVTVEYLEPSMSRGLLSMFPDNSAFGFDYAQSGIWSPLNKVPRAASPAASADGSTDFLIANSKRRARGASSRLKERSRWRRRRLRRDGSFLNLHEMGRAKLDFSPPPPPPQPSPPAKVEGWRRMLKAAIRKFKSRQRRSRPAPLLQMIVPTL